MTNLTAALTALAGHYQANPELPSWNAINYSRVDKTIRVLVTLDNDSAADALIAWSDSLEDHEIWVKRFQVGWSNATHDQVLVHADIDGQQIVIWREVPGFGEFIGAPEVESLGKQVLVQSSAAQLRAFHLSGRDHIDTVAA